jgi:hypothetical protein
MTPGERARRIVPVDKSTFAQVLIETMQGNKEKDLVQRMEAERHYHRVDGGMHVDRKVKLISEHLNSEEVLAQYRRQDSDRSPSPEKAVVPSYEDWKAAKEKEK